MARTRWWIDAAIPPEYDRLPRGLRDALNELEAAVDQYAVATMNPTPVEDRMQVHAALRQARVELATTLRRLLGGD